jgi:hypothetical protein
VAYEMRVEFGKANEFARAVQWTPEPPDPASICHPTFLTTARLLWEPLAERADMSLGFDLSRTLHGEEEFVFHGRPPRIGETLRVSSYVGERWEVCGRRGGRMRFARVVSEFRDLDGKLRAEQCSTIIETEARQVE